ncbi:MAG: alpha/beta hydrolase [Bacteroidota bacterium]
MPQIVRIGLIFIGVLAGLVHAQLAPLASMQDLSYPFPDKKIMLSNEVEIAYVEEGSSGETLLFIHGLGSYLPAWQENIKTLRTSYRCIAIDLPGYGKSSKGAYSGSMEFFSKVVAEFIDSMKLGRVTLVGHSMGGQISMVTTIAFPQKVQRLILCDPAGFETFTEGQKQWFREILSARGVKLTPVNAIWENIAYNFYDMPKSAHFMAWDRINMRSAKEFDWYCYIIPKCVQGMVDRPVYNQLSAIKVPVLVIFGENDNLIPNRFLNPGRTRAVAESGASQLPNHQLVMVPKAGHFAMFEQAETVNAAITAFMAGKPIEGAEKVAPAQ